MKTAKKKNVFTRVNAKRIVIGLFFGGIFLQGCQKDNTEVPKYNIPDQVELINIPDSPGTWWKYEWYSVDQDGNAVSMDAVDSVYVIGDTVMNGSTFVQLKGAGSWLANYSTPYKFLRDSSNCILNSHGDIIYSTHEELDTTKIFTSGPFTAHMMTGANLSSYTVPAGTFNNILQNQTHFYMTDESLFACGDHWIKRSYYAEGVGIIMAQCYFISQLTENCSHIEMRLIDYSIAP